VECVCSVCYAQHVSHGGEHVASAGGDPTQHHIKRKIRFGAVCMPQQKFLCLCCALCSGFLATTCRRFSVPCFFDEFHQVASELVAGGRSIAARYRRWNCDRAIEWEMDGGKGEEAGGGSATVIQCVVHEVGGRMAFPLLTKTNYSDWAMLMQVKLNAHGLRVTVDKSSVDPQEDMMALDALMLAVPPEMVATVVDKSMVKEARDVIATMRVGDDRVKKAVTQQLRSQFDHAMFWEGETVEDFSLRLNGMVATLATREEIVEEQKVVKKILHCVPLRLKQIALAISMLLDVVSLTIANLAGQLKPAEEAFEEPPFTLQHDVKLYLTEEEWDARHVDVSYAAS
jgi:hypothetical protein